MAKVSNSVSFKNCEIKNGYIEEVTKDETFYYSLKKIIDQWSNIPGLSITIKYDDDLPEMMNDEEEDEV